LRKRRGLRKKEVKKSKDYNSNFGNSHSLLQGGLYEDNQKISDYFFRFDFIHLDDLLPSIGG
jgi:hypothetical protein